MKRKLISFVLTLTFVFAMAIPALALEIDTTYNIDNFIVTEQNEFVQILDTDELIEVALFLLAEDLIEVESDGSLTFHQLLEETHFECGYTETTIAAESLILIDEYAEIVDFNDLLSDYDPLPSYDFDIDISHDGNVLISTLSTSERHLSRSQSTLSNGHTIVNTLFFTERSSNNFLTRDGVRINRVEVRITQSSSGTVIPTSVRIGMFQSDWATDPGLETWRTFPASSSITMSNTSTRWFNPNSGHIRITSRVYVTFSNGSQAVVQTNGMVGPI